MDKKGFTLIEMLAVIAIIGILAGLLIPAATKARRDAAIQKAKTTISALETALSMYYTDYGAYPPSCVDASNQGNGNAFRSGASSIIGSDNTIAGDNNLVDMLTLTTKGGPYMKFRAEDLLKTGTGTSTRYVLKDPWGRAYIYINRSGYTGVAAGPYHPYFTDVAEGSDPGAQSGPILDRNTYNIYSLGPDGRTFGGATHTDADNWNNSATYNNLRDGYNRLTDTTLSGGTSSITGPYNDDDINNW